MNLKIFGVLLFSALLFGYVQTARLPQYVPAGGDSCVHSGPAFKVFINCHKTSLNEIMALCQTPGNQCNTTDEATAIKSENAITDLNLTLSKIASGADLVICDAEYTSENTTQEYFDLGDPNTPPSYWSCEEQAIRVTK